MEEYEPHVVRGNVIYAGVDYEAIVRAAENDPEGCDVILWDGGNNDFPFYKPDLTIGVVDPHRPGHELTYYPGEVVLRISDVVIINKMDSASPEGIQVVRESIEKVNPGAIVIDGASPITGGQSGCDQRQKGTGGGRWAHPDPWRNENWCRGRSCKKIRGGRAGGSQALHGGKTYRDL